MPRLVLFIACLSDVLSDLNREEIVRPEGSSADLFIFEPEETFAIELLKFICVFANVFAALRAVVFVLTVKAILTSFDYVIGFYCNLFTGKEIRMADFF
jgi:hypothetical protein